MALGPEAAALTALRRIISSKRELVTSLDRASIMSSFYQVAKNVSCQHWSSLAAACSLPNGVKVFLVVTCSLGVKVLWGAANGSQGQSRNAMATVWDREIRPMVLRRHPSPFPLSITQQNITCPSLGGTTALGGRRQLLGGRIRYFSPTIADGLWGHKVCALSSGVTQLTRSCLLASIAGPAGGKGSNFASTS